ncbi:MAG: hypothetical protein KIT43_10490 [Bauldia sp.]|nr:hypothetical protein [Bauldia sp.]
MPDTIVGGSAAAILTNLYDLRDLGLIDADVAARIEAALGSGNSAVIARAVDDLEATEADAAYFGLDADVNALRADLAASVGYAMPRPVAYGTVNSTLDTQPDPFVAPPPPAPGVPRALRDATYPLVGGGMYEPPRVQEADDLRFFEQFYRYDHPLILGPDGLPVTDRFGNPMTAPFLIGMTGTGEIPPLPLPRAEALAEVLTGNPVREDGVEGDFGVWNYEHLRTNEFGEVTGGTAHPDADGNIDQITINAALFPYERRQTTVHEVAHAIFDVIEADPDYRPILDQLEPALLEIWRTFNADAPDDLGYDADAIAEGLAEFLRNYDANSAWMNLNYSDVVETIMWIVNTHPEIAPYVQMVMAEGDRGAVG